MVTTQGRLIILTLVVMMALVLLLSSIDLGWIICKNIVYESVILLPLKKQAQVFQ
jgi:hypothetical protein